MKYYIDTCVISTSYSVLARDVIEALYTNVRDKTRFPRWTSEDLGNTDVSLLQWINRP